MLIWMHDEYDHFSCLKILFGMLPILMSRTTAINLAHNKVWWIHVRKHGTCPARFSFSPLTLGFAHWFGGFFNLWCIYFKRKRQWPMTLSLLKMSLQLWVLCQLKESLGRAISKDPGPPHAIRIIVRVQIPGIWLKSAFVYRAWQRGFS